MRPSIVEVSLEVMLDPVTVVITLLIVGVYMPLASAKRPVPPVIVLEMTMSLRSGIRATPFFEVVPYGTVDSVDRIW